jgi:hypothetical protein
MNRTIVTLVITVFFLAAVTTGCKTSSSESASAGTTDNASGTSGGSPAAVAESRDVQVPAGTVLTIEFDDTVSTESSAPGDRFVATVVEPVYADRTVAIDRGSTVSGKVLEVKSGKKIGGKARLDLQFTALELPGGAQEPLDATFYSEGKSQAGKDAATIGGSTAGGALLGRIIGHQSDRDDEGTAIGAIVGAAVGTAIAASNNGQPVTISAGTRLSIRLDSPVTITL